MATVVITGGSGLIGQALTHALLRKGHKVRHLGRSVREVPSVATFKWDIRAGTIDSASVIGVDHIVHLAGAGIADARWTKERVRELVDSRAASVRLLQRAVREHGQVPNSFVSAAGINYYGATTSDRTCVESDAAGGDSIGMISRKWEEAVDEWASMTRVVKLRTPIVLSAEGGALSKLAMPFRWGLGAALGSGKQWMPWVHIDDLVWAYESALFNDRMTGAYNVNANGTVNNEEFTTILARSLGKKVFLPNVPGFVLKATLGEMADLLLAGSRASNEKILATGFEFRFNDLAMALDDLLE